MYSGYSYMPLSILLGRMARRTEMHLMANGKGNYAPYGLADLLAGTAMGGDFLEDLVEEADRSEVTEKVKGRAKKAGKQAKGRKDKARRMLRSDEDDQ